MPTIRYSRVIRDLARLAEREFDVLVVGGGIYGLTIAYDAAQRGLVGRARRSRRFRRRHVVQSSEDHPRRAALPAVGRFSAHARVDPRAARVCAHRSALGRAAWRSPCRPVLRSRAIRSRCERRSRSTRWSAAIATKASIPHGSFRPGASSPAPNVENCSTARSGACRRPRSGTTIRRSAAIVSHWPSRLARQHMAPQLANYAEATSPLRLGGKLAGVARA